MAFFNLMFLPKSRGTGPTHVRQNLRIKSYCTRAVNDTANAEAMAVYGCVNGHLRAWKDDGEFLRRGCFAQDRRCAWHDHFLEDSAMGWRGCEGLYLPYPLLTKEGKRKARG